MGKAVMGAVEIGAAVGLAALVVATAGAATPLAALEAAHLLTGIALSLAVSGVASEAGAVADALAGNRGASITTRQPACNAGLVYGEFRVGGTLVYASTTGGHKDQYNKVVALAAHPCDSVVNMYLDGRQVYWRGGQAQQNVGGVYFGGDADGNNHYDAGNNRYNFGSLVYAESHLGTDQPGYYSGALHANDPTWGPTSDGTPYGGDVTSVYVKVEYDSAMFPQPPEMRFTIRGKNNIWDPRNNSYGYTTNWALIVADHLMNSDWGFGIPQALINKQQLIMSANLCDELVPLGNGGSEPRYTFNGAFDTSSSPGDILQTMMASAAGSITFAGGQYYIFPAVAFPISFTFGENDLLGGIQGSAYRSNRDLYNRVVGTFTCPNYPYAPAGNLYNSNGHDPDGYSQNNTNYAYQQTSYPPYAQDHLHGYPVDQWLNQDGGTEKWMSLNLPGVTSLATAQRLAKIALLRNRLQRGKYQFRFKLTAYRMMVNDVFELNFSQLGWVNKQLQVTDMSFGIDYPESGPPQLYVAVSAQDYDPDVYSWTPIDELTILDAPTSYAQGSYDVAAPTSINLTSGPATSIINTDGTLIPRVLVAWTDPQDVLVTLIEVQWCPSGSGAWTSIGTTPVGNGSCYMLGPVANQAIDVRVRSLRGKGAASSWDTITGYLVEDTSISTLNSTGFAPNIPFNQNNNCTIDTIVGDANNATLRVYGPGGPGTHFQTYVGAIQQDWAAEQTSVPYGSSGYAILAKYLFITVGFRQVQYKLFTVANFNDTLNDSTIFLGPYTAVASSGTGGNSGGGGAGGNGGGGPRCTVEGTLLDTPDGPVNNVLLKHRLDIGVPVYLTGGDGNPERLVAASWHWESRHQRLTVGDVVIECSDTHTVSVAGVHTRCSLVPDGTVIDTRTGPQVMRREAVRGDRRVLELTLDGPTHIYSASGLLTHNFLKYQTGNPN